MRWVFFVPLIAWTLVLAAVTLSLPRPCCHHPPAEVFVTIEQRPYEPPPPKQPRPAFEVIYADRFIVYEKGNP